MKKFNILFAIASLLIFAQGAWAQDQEPHFKTIKDTDGTVLQDGSENKPFLIASIEDLNGLAADIKKGLPLNEDGTPSGYWGTYFKLTTDLDYSEIELKDGSNFTPIGIEGEDPESPTDDLPFMGVFDGDGHTIRGITINQPEGFNIALFGYIHGATIKNLTVANSNFTGSIGVGGIAGYTNPSEHWIENCHVASDVTITANGVEDYMVGGIVGCDQAGTLTNCTSAAKVVGTEAVGGIVGSISLETVLTDCYYLSENSNVTGSTKVGVIFGENEEGLVPNITLFADDSEQTIKNATRLNSYNGQTANVTMSGLELANDDKWSTICLPFEMSGFDGTPLAGAGVNVKVFKAAEYKGNTLTATFEDASKIDVGMPYIVKGAALKSPEFETVKVGIETSATTVEHVTFTGTFDPVTLNENDRTILYLGDDNKLYFPKEVMTINPFHAYFKLQEGIKACSSDGNVNGDENVTVADITSLVNIIPALPPEKAGIADVNDDNNVTVDDVAALANIILGKDIEGAMRAIKTDDAIGISYGFGGSSEKPARARKM